MWSLSNLLFPRQLESVPGGVADAEAGAVPKEKVREAGHVGRSRQEDDALGRSPLLSHQGCDPGIQGT